MSLSEAFAKRSILNATLEITGDKELVSLLEGLRSKKMATILRPAFRAGAKVIAREARRRVPVRTGFLKKAIKAIAARRDASAMVVMNRKISNPAEMRSADQSGGRIRRPYRPAYIARIVERGAYITWESRKGAARIPKQPFLAPALEAKRQEALDKIAFYLRKEIENPGFIEKIRKAYYAGR